MYVQGRFTLFSDDLIRWQYLWLNIEDTCITEAEKGEASITRITLPFDVITLKLKHS